MLCEAAGFGVILKNGCKSRVKCFLFRPNQPIKEDQTIALSVRFYILSKKAVQLYLYRVFCGINSEHEKDAQFSGQHL